MKKKSNDVKINNISSKELKTFLKDTKKGKYGKK